MDITPLVGADRQVILSYSGGAFKISGRAYTGPVVVYPDRVEPWAATLPVTAAMFAPLAGAGLDVILFGTGKAFAPLPPVLRKALKESGLGVEAMDTGAACRTYNVLMAEGRRVAAALMPV